MRPHPNPNAMHFVPQFQFKRAHRLTNMSRFVYATYLSKVRVRVRVKARARLRARVRVRARVWVHDLGHWADLVTGLGSVR